MKFEQALFYFKRRRNKVQLMEEECAIAALEKQMPKKLRSLKASATFSECKNVIVLIAASLWLNFTIARSLCA